MKTTGFRPFIVVYLMAMVVMHAFVFRPAWNSVLLGYSDFAAFYTAGTLLRQRNASGLYDPHQQWKVQQQFASEVRIRKGPLPYIRPPFESLLFLPFSYLKYPSAYLSWSAINVVLLLVIPFVARPTGGRALLPPALSGVLCFGLFPVGLDLLHGQDAIVLLLVFVLTFHLLRKGAEFWSGCALALGLFKFHLVIPVAAVFLLRRKSRFGAGFLLVGAVLAGISVGLVGWRGILQYPWYVLRLDQSQGMGVTTWLAMPNVRALLTGLTPGHVQGIPMTCLWGAIAVSGLIVGAQVWQNHSRGTETSLAAGFSLAVAITIMTSYYAYGYDLILLLIPILLIGGEVLDKVEFRGWPRGFFVVATVLLLFTPLYWYLKVDTNQFYWVSLLPPLLMTVALLGILRRAGTTSQPDPLQAMEAKLPA